MSCETQEEAATCTRLADKSSPPSTDMSGSPTPSSPRPPDASREDIFACVEPSLVVTSPDARLLGGTRFGASVTPSRCPSSRTRSVVWSGPSSATCSAATAAAAAVFVDRHRGVPSVSVW
ncbi:unnamed protein product, partial [Ectocarpus sp. 8 AP-2014]